MSGPAKAAPGKAVVLGGKTGMLGTALVHVLDKAGWDTVPVGRGDIDVLDSAELGDFLDRVKPGHVFNAVAYTQVDQAEDEPEKAYAVNKHFPASLGRLARDRGIWLVHYSTDFVFDGRCRREPYEPEDKTNPLSVYGKSKDAGDKALLELKIPDLTIIRTSWLFGPGRKNFVRTILNLASEREELRVVHDQEGSPTFTMDLAANSLALIEKQGRGLFHLANSGKASWCELASEAVSMAGINCQVQAIPSSEYPTKAFRPPYSVLSLRKFTEQTGITPRPWLQALRDYVFQELNSKEES